jgi:hypothetical protein
LIPLELDVPQAVVEMKAAEAKLQAVNPEGALAPEQKPLGATRLTLRVVKILRRRHIHLVGSPGEFPFGPEVKSPSELHIVTWTIVDNNARDLRVAIREKGHAGAQVSYRRDCSTQPNRASRKVDRRVGQTARLRLNHQSTRRLGGAPGPCKKNYPGDEHECGNGIDPLGLSRRFAPYAFCSGAGDFGRLSEAFRFP